MGPPHLQQAHWRWPARLRRDAGRPLANVLVLNDYKFAADEYEVVELTCNGNFIDDDVLLLARFPKDGQRRRDTKSCGMNSSQGAMPRRWAATWYASRAGFSRFALSAESARSKN